MKFPKHVPLIVLRTLFAVLATSFAFIEIQASKSVFLTLPLMQNTDGQPSAAPPPASPLPVPPPAAASPSPPPAASPSPPPAASPSPPPANASPAPPPAGPAAVKAAELNITSISMSNSGLKVSFEVMSGNAAVAGLDAGDFRLSVDGSPVRVSRLDRAAAGFYTASGAFAPKSGANTYGVDLTLYGAGYYAAAHAQYTMPMPAGAGDTPPQAPSTGGAATKTSADEAASNIHTDAAPKAAPETQTEAQTKAAAKPPSDSAGALSGGGAGTSPAGAQSAAKPSPAPSSDARPAPGASGPARTSSPSSLQSAPDGYVIPDSDSAYISRAELEAMDPSVLKFARNEIFARHGYIFKKKIFRDYFSVKSWYRPVPSYKGDFSVLSRVEAVNAMTIKSVEKKRAKGSSP